MVVKIKFSTGKEIELNDVELRELYGQVQQQPVFINPVQWKPWWEQPYYGYPPTITCKSDS
jgi:hypothetical protein